jgi:hypothetical protein
VSVDRDGRFLFDGLAPGKYRVEAFTLGARSGDGRGVHTAEWAEADLLLDGSDQDGIVLTLRPTIRVSGTIVARRSAGPGAAVPTVEVFLLPERQDGGAASNTRAAVVQGNHFTLESVIPGRYRILAEVRPGLGPTQWAFDTGALDGREASDQSVEIGPADTAATIVLTDVASAVSGSVKTPGGRAVSDLSALVFSTSPSDWYWQSRRVEGVHLDTAGSFEVGGLPAGDYYLAVLRDIDSTDWYDPDLLRSVIPSAVTLRVTPGRRTTQDVQVLERAMFGY